MDVDHIEYFEGFELLCRALRGGGAFLVAQDADGKPNPMTIGWGTVGVVWGQPTLTVLVRPSRFTFGLMEKAERFSVCVPDGGMKDELEFCGTRSGRDHDKVAECRLKVAPGLAPGVSVLEDCALFFECETSEKTKVLEEHLGPEIKSRYYEGGDYHTIYFGRILHSYKK